MTSGAGGPGRGEVTSQRGQGGGRRVQESPARGGDVTGPGGGAWGRVSVAWGGGGMERDPGPEGARRALGRLLEAVLASRGRANAVFDILAVLQVGARGARRPGLGGRMAGPGVGQRWGMGAPATSLFPQSEDHAETQEAVRACSRLFGALLERGELFVGRLPSEGSAMAGERPRGAGPSSGCGPAGQRGRAGGGGRDSPAARSPRGLLVASDAVRSVRSASQEAGVMRPHPRSFRFWGKMRGEGLCPRGRRFFRPAPGLGPR